MDPFDFSKVRMRWTKVSILALVLISCLSIIFVLGLEVNRKIQLQATAGQDNINWNVAQLETEATKFLNATLVAELNPTPTKQELAEVRRWFNVYYSRVQTFTASNIYEGVRSRDNAGQVLTDIRDQLDSVVQYIDGSDAELIAGLAELDAVGQAVAQASRAIALNVLSYFSEQADTERLAIWSTLIRVASLTVALVLTLVVLSVVLFQLYRVAQTRSMIARETTSRLEAMVSSTLDAVIVINEAGEVVEFNGAAEQIFGYSRHEVMGQPMVDLIIPLKYRKAHLEGMRRHLTKGTRHVVGKGRIQMEALRKSGEVFPCEFSISRAQSSDGTLFVSFLRDNSAQVEAETALLKARDDALAGERTKAEFIAVMSHEMRTPLNGMLGTLELLNDTDLTSRQRHFIRIMETSGRLLLHHVNDVLDIARLDSGQQSNKSEAFVLDELVQQVIETQRAMAHANSTQIEIDTSTLRNPTVLGDPQALRQVLLNLVSNAIKFTRDGVVRIEAEMIGSGDLIEFRVSDTGLGIAENDMDRIFDDFVTVDSSFSREFGGTGLGLGIARRLVESAGGNIGVESEPNQGSLFWFRLPLPILSSINVEPPEPKIVKTIAELPSALDVLVVEDNQINQLVVQEMLTKDGHTVSIANDGEEGVEMASMHRYDIILMDVSMPRMDGIEACRTIRAGDGLSKDTMIVALTAHALPDDLARFQEAGMNDSLVKPLSRSALNRVLANKSQAMTGAAETKQPDVVEPIAPPPQPVSLDAIDRSVVDGLKQDLGAERTNVLIQSFLSETDTMVDGFAANPNPDDKELIAEIHKLAGSASMFGTVDLRDLLRELETLGKQGDVEEMRETLPAVTDIWADTRAGLVSLLSSETADLREA
jgi:PAS domain S-box-containing protein